MVLGETDAGKKVKERQEDKNRLIASNLWNKKKSIQNKSKKN